MAVFTPESGRSAALAASQCEVDVAPLREAFLANGIKSSDVARSLEWTRKTRGVHVPDTDRVRRYLGLIPYPRGCGYPPRLRERCAYKTAIKLALAMGLDPIDVGL